MADDDEEFEFEYTKHKIRIKTECKMHQIIQGTTWPFNESQNSNSEQRRDSVTSTIRQAYSQGSATHHQYKTFSTKKSESSSKSSTTTSSAVNNNN
uniref:Uncharacterized protein n=1 Tax=Sarcoptes scabiei TaxID=52283 RepID=A0A834VID0_SARSC